MIKGTPIFSSVINRIIEKRIAAGKGPLGFLNPVLYRNAWALNDITNGSNPGCGTEGFYTAPGYVFPSRSFISLLSYFDIWSHANNR